VDVLVVLAILAILAVVVWAVSAPLRAGAAVEDADAAAREELEAAKAAKYREIRDAELDHRTGKLDDADFRAVDRQLRAEAVAILREIDRLGGK
jgi:Na+-transporting methylmalonyl-CoA/oxaloacetate decarboxylase gamma subunit